MLRRMKVFLSVVAATFCLGLGPPALASGIFEEREPLIDREDLVEELILRERLFGGAFLSPFAISPFGISPFGFGRDALVVDLLLRQQLIEELVEEREELLGFGVFDAEELFDAEDLFELEDDEDD